MTKIKLEIEETHLYKAVRSCIDHTNGDEIAKLLTNMIGFSDQTSSLFFKIYLGDVAPTVLPRGTMVKVDPSRVSFSIKPDLMREKGLLDASGNCTVMIRDFQGFYQPTTYYVSFHNVNDKGEVFEDTGFLSYTDILEVIEEF